MCRLEPNLQVLEGSSFQNCFVLFHVLHSFLLELEVSLLLDRIGHPASFEHGDILFKVCPGAGVCSQAGAISFYMLFAVCVHIFVGAKIADVHRARVHEGHESSLVNLYKAKGTETEVSWRLFSNWFSAERSRQCSSHWLFTCGSSAKSWQSPLPKIFRPGWPCAAGPPAGDRRGGPFVIAAKLGVVCLGSKCVAARGIGIVSKPSRLIVLDCSPVERERPSCRDVNWELCIVSRTFSNLRKS